MDNEIVSGQEALALVRKLQTAKAYPVREWYDFEHLIPKTPGAYRFTDPDGLRVYVGEAEKSLRNRLSKQVMPHRFGRPWTLERPPPRGVCTSRNLLNNVLKDQRDGRALVEPFANIDQGDPGAIEALNRAFHTIDGLAVQWVKCPADMRKRVEHLAGRCVFDRRCAEDSSRAGI